MSESRETVALVLGCDLTKEGRLGPHTIARLDRALDWHLEHRYPIMVAAPRSPYHPRLPVTMAELMAEYLARRRCYNIILGLAPSFDTRGELTALQEVTAKKYVIISAWWHLPRTRVIAWQVMGITAPVKLVPVWSDRPTVKQVLLEVPKFVHVFLPARLRRLARTLGEKVFGRVSY